MTSVFKPTPIIFTDTYDGDKMRRLANDVISLANRVASISTSAQTGGTVPSPGSASLVLTSGAGGTYGWATAPVPASVPWNNLTGVPTSFNPAIHLLASTSGLGPDHTIAGASPGMVLLATGSAAAQFGFLNYANLGDVNLSGLTPGMSPVWNGIAWVPANISPVYSGLIAGQVFSATGPSSAGFVNFNGSQVVAGQIQPQFLGNGNSSPPPQYGTGYPDQDTTLVGNGYWTAIQSLDVSWSQISDIPGVVTGLQAFDGGGRAGLVPAIKKRQNYFLRDDGTWSPATGTGGGTVTSVATGTGLTGGPITGSGTISLATISNDTVLGNVSGITNAPVALTQTQLTTLINAFTSSLSGAVPASGGGTTNFLRADGTWAAPSGGGGGVTSLTSGTGIALTPSTITSTGSIALANIGADTVLGNNTGSSAAPTALTQTQLTALINTFTASLSGAVPSPGSATGKFLRDDGTWDAVSTGTVTSVAMTVPTILSVAGSPISTSGTLAVTLATQNANLVFAGPTSGGAGTPTFRSLVAADLPLATTGAFGAVKPDGTSITISAGVISTASSFPTLSSAILTDTPFAFWECNDASTSLADSSGNGFNLTTINGSPSFQSGALIASLPTTTFVNMNGYTNTTGSAGAQLASALGKTLPLTQWTFECVVLQFTTSSVGRFFLWATSGTTDVFAIFNIAGALSVGLNNTSTTIVPSMPIGVPVHVVVTCTTVSTTSTLTTYYNGVKVGSVTATASTATGTSTVGIGDITNGGVSTGFTIGYMALYSAALSQARIVAHAQSAGLFAV